MINQFDAFLLSKTQIRWLWMKKIQANLLKYLRGLFESIFSNNFSISVSIFTHFKFECQLFKNYQFIQFLLSGFLSNETMEEFQKLIKKCFVLLFFTIDKCSTCPIALCNLAKEIILIDEFWILCHSVQFFSGPFD